MASVAFLLSSITVSSNLPETHNIKTSERSFDTQTLKWSPRREMLDDVFQRTRQKGLATSSTEHHVTIKEVCFLKSMLKYQRVVPEEKVETPPAS